MNNSFFIGWDVGAWMTRRGDALWILNSNGATVGIPWCGNLGTALQEANSAEDFIHAVFETCQEQIPTGKITITMAIDAPFAFPIGFVNLLGAFHSPEYLDDALGNPYLFRRTERYAAGFLGRNPLSAVQDRIGSQTTKILHFLTKFGLTNNAEGVWHDPMQDSFELSVIEAYPAMCKALDGTIRPDPVNIFYQNQLENNLTANQDIRDALLCAIIAHLHANNNGLLCQPVEGDNFHPLEGWIWFPVFNP